MIVNFSPVNLKQIQKTRQNCQKQLISFGNQSDSFQRNTSSMFNVFSPKETTDIINIVKNKTNFIGDGWTADVYRYNDCAIKVLKEVPKDKDFAAFLSGLSPTEKSSYFLKELQKEFLALKYIEAAGVDDAQRAIDIIQDGNNHYLVTSFVNGSFPDSKKANLKNSHIVDMVKKLTKLDQTGFVHHDLQPGNFFIDAGKVKLIDASANTFANSIDKNHPEKYLFNNEIKAQKIYNIFGEKSIPAIYPRQSYIDNPYLNIDSNLANFEQRGLHCYLGEMAKSDDGKPQEALDFFKEYLKIKSEFYHKPMTKYLEEIDLEEAAKQSGISVEDAGKLNNLAIAHEKMAASILANPSDEVIKTEIQKTQMRVMIRENANQFSLIKFMDDFENNLKTYSENATGEIKEYFDSNKKFIDVFKPHKEVCNTTGKELADEDNLFKLLYKNINSTINNDIIPEKTKKKIIIPIVLGTVFLGGIAYFMKNKNKEKTPQEISSSPNNLAIHQQNIPVNNTNPNKNFSPKINNNIFKDFVLN
ncbi:MAG: hypothetical protein PHV68_06370 [Candidatus Gastranaerophilales bacterium]|nr:hypothetical protein [Candidatus Gastranaerophilales bacterium]